MSYARNSVLLCCLLAGGLVACSGGNAHHSAGPGVNNTGDSDDGGSAQSCIDNDNDGFGAYCAHPKDCDDNDPDITDECVRCRSANDDCPCTTGVPPLGCSPPDIEVDGGTYQCKEGTRYCRHGRWSKCEQVGNYVFVPNQ